ncbi:MAG: hypothetical protein ACP5OF_01495 [bacterium]
MKFEIQPVPKNIPVELQQFLNKLQVFILQLETYMVSQKPKILFSNGSIDIPKNSPADLPVSLSDQYTILVLGTGTISVSSQAATMTVKRIDNGAGNFGVFQVRGYGRITFSSTYQLTAIAIPL